MQKQLSHWQTIPTAPAVRDFYTTFSSANVDTQRALVATLQAEPCAISKRLAIIAGAALEEDDVLDQAVGYPAYDDLAFYALRMLARREHSVQRIVSSDYQEALSPIRRRALFRYLWRYGHHQALPELAKNSNYPLTAREAVTVAAIEGTATIETLLPYSAQDIPWSRLLRLNPTLAVELFDAKLDAVQTGHEGDELDIEQTRNAALQIWRAAKSVVQYLQLNDALDDEQLGRKLRGLTPQDIFPLTLKQSKLANNGRSRSGLTRGLPPKDEQAKRMAENLPKPTATNTPEERWASILRRLNNVATANVAQELLLKELQACPYLFGRSLEEAHRFTADPQSRSRQRELYRAWLASPIEFYTEANQAALREYLAALFKDSLPEDPPHLQLRELVSGLYFRLLQLSDGKAPRLAEVLPLREGAFRYCKRTWPVSARRMEAAWGIQLSDHLTRHLQQSWWPVVKEDFLNEDAQNDVTDEDRILEYIRFAKNADDIASHVVPVLVEGIRTFKCLNQRGMAAFYLRWFCDSDEAYIERLIEIAPDTVADDDAWPLARQLSHPICWQLLRDPETRGRAFYRLVEEHTIVEGTSGQTINAILAGRDSFDGFKGYPIQAQHFPDDVQQILANCIRHACYHNRISYESGLLALAAKNAYVTAGELFDWLSHRPDEDRSPARDALTEDFIESCKDLNFPCCIVRRNPDAPVNEDDDIEALWEEERQDVQNYVLDQMLRRHPRAYACANAIRDFSRYPQWRTLLGTLPATLARLNPLHVHSFLKSLDKHEWTDPAWQHALRASLPNIPTWLHRDVIARFAGPTLLLPEEAFLTIGRQARLRF